MLAVLLLSGLFAGSAFAQDVMTLSAGGVDEKSLLPNFECFYEIDFEDVGLSPDVLYPMMTSALYGLDMSGGGGLSDGGAVAQFCTVNWGYEPCGSCRRRTMDGIEFGRIKYNELWCLGIRVIRDESCWGC